MPAYSKSVLFAFTRSCRKATEAISHTSDALRISDAARHEARMRKLATTTPLIEYAATGIQQQFTSLSNQGSALIIRQRQEQQNAPTRGPTARQYDSSKMSSRTILNMPQPQSTPKEAWFPGPQPVYDLDALSILIKFDKSRAALRMTVAAQHQREKVLDVSRPLRQPNNTQFLISGEAKARLMCVDPSYYGPMESLGGNQISHVWYNFFRGLGNGFVRSYQTFLPEWISLKTLFVVVIRNEIKFILVPVDKKHPGTRRMPALHSFRSELGRDVGRCIFATWLSR